MSSAVDILRHLNTLWVGVYTAGLTDAQKARRRGEVRSDVHEQMAFFRAEGQSDAAINRGIASRTIRGVLADVAWRLDAGREGEIVVRHGGSPPLPWLTMLFVASVIVAGCLSSTQVEWLGDTRATLGILSAFGAGVLWLGLYLASHRFAGPLLVAVGTATIAWCLWWTIVAPVVAVGVGVAGVRRAQRLEALIETA
jgi:hypothetical protein